MDIMLTEVCRECLKYFPKTAQKGEFTISGGVIAGLNPKPLDGQYIRVIGSIFNDGVYKYAEPLGDARDETFTGSVWLLAVPPDFLALVDEIREFQTKNSTAKSAFTSEVFPNYTYTKAVGEDGLTAGWQDVFRSRLNKFRRMYEERL